MRLPSIRRSSYDDETLGVAELTGLWVSFAIGVPLVLVGLQLMSAREAGGLGFSGTQLLLSVPLGVLLGVGLLVAVAHSAASVGERTAVLIRPAVGYLGSWLYVPVGLAFLLCWTAVELHAAGRAVERAFDLLGGGRIDWAVGSAVVAAVAAVLLLLGPQTVARTWVRWFAFWVGLAVMVVLVWRVVADIDFGALLDLPPAPHFWLGVDLIVGAAVLLFPLVADTVRFAHDESTAASSVGAGFGVPALIALLLGGLAAFVSGVTDPTPAGLVAELFGSTAGVIGGVLALAWVLAGETDQPFAYTYSAAVTAETLLARIPLGLTSLPLLAGALAVALTVEVSAVLDLLGWLLSLLVPLVGVYLADFFVVRRRSYLSDALYDRRGAYRGINVYALPSLVLGFVLYQWLSPVGPKVWMEWVGESLPAGPSGVPPVLVTMAFSFASYAILGRWRIEQAYYISRLRV